MPEQLTPEERATRVCEQITASDYWERDDYLARGRIIAAAIRDAEAPLRAERDAAVKRLQEILYRIVVELDIDDSTDTDSPDAIVASVAGLMEDLNALRARAGALATALSDAGEDIEDWIDDYENSQKRGVAARSRRLMKEIGATLVAEERRTMTEKITEEMGVHTQWYEDARNVTTGTLPEFVRHLTEDYDHDYGTICHAVAAAAIAAAWAVESSPSGGITGFQSGAVMWQFITGWMSEYKDKPLRLINYEDFLYPQYAYTFEKTISPSTWTWLQEQATGKLAEDDEKPLDVRAAPFVRRHWQSIVDGKVPFGYHVIES